MHKYAHIRCICPHTHTDTNIHKCMHAHTHVHEYIYETKHFLFSWFRTVITTHQITDEYQAWQIQHIHRNVKYLCVEITLQMEWDTSYSLILPFHVQPSLTQIAASVSTSLRAALSGKACAHNTRTHEQTRKNTEVYIICILAQTENWTEPNTGDTFINEK